MYKNVIISGVSSGIGKSVAELLIKKYDCTVYGIARDENKIKEFKNSLGEKSVNLADYFLFDVSSEESWQNFVRDFTEKGYLADAIINCAGILPKFASTEKTSVKTYEKVMSINFFGCVYSAKYVLPILEKHGKRAILNVSSSSALCTFSGISAYGASKAALKSFTMSLADEQRGKTKVSCVCPGFVATNVMRNQSASEKDLKIINKFSSSPEFVAKKIIKTLKRGKKFKVIGYDAKLMNFFYKIAPVTTARAISGILRRSKMDIFKDI